MSLRQDQTRIRYSLTPVAENLGELSLPTPTLQLGPSQAIEPATMTISHTVGPGETLLAIALTYDVELESILEANLLDNPDVLDVGQELSIPGVPIATEVPDRQDISGGQYRVNIIEKPANVTVNGLSETSFIIMPAAVKQNAEQIFNRGQELGRNSGAFSVVGDSTTEIPFFLARFDRGPYNLGEYQYLQSVIDYFKGSFARDSASVRVGLHSYTLFDPIWADKAVCMANEAALACEIRLNNPSVIIFRLGSNDVGVPELFEESMSQAVAYAIDRGVIPIIGTKADRFEGSNQNNEILRQIATDYQVPLWDYDVVAATIDGRGLDADGVHMTTFYLHDYTRPEAYQRGHAMHNLTALMVLDTIWKEVILPNRR
ncbi:MAG: LysM peptidoglycan-binding domain-containing protein [Candidatus Promineifilaceae bacterium]|nr:LysM peptidoglycan-binding domain-containing protein [Candidatus Promineifilaceae bacterium]